MEKHFANQATQLAKQDEQIGLLAQQNHLQSVRATNDAMNANIEAQLRTPMPSNRTDFAPTATALAFQSIQVEATRQAIEVKQKQIEASQTAIAQPLTTLSSPNLQAQVDVGCAGRERGATVNGNSVPVSDWQSDCAYHPGIFQGSNVLLTTWGIIQEYSDSKIVSARIISPGVNVIITGSSTNTSSNFALFAGYRSFEGANLAYRNTSPDWPTPIP